MAYTPVTLAVPKGGTGQVTLTSHGVLVGEGTSAIGQVAAGSAGQVLQSGGAAADPVYSTATFPATAGTTGTLLRSNGTNWVNTSASYPSTIAANQMLYASGNNVIADLPSANSAILATNSSGVPSITTASGNWLNTSRCCFSSFLAANDTNETGDGTVYTFGSGSALTILFDQGSNMNTNGTFTAPVTGRYFFSGNIRLGNLGAGHTLSQITVKTTSINYTYGEANAGLARSVSTAANLYSICYSCIANMTAGDTCVITVAVFGSTKTVSINGAASPNYTCTFQGYLIC